MFKSKLFGLSLFLLSGLILFSSCAKAPEKEMQAARDAVANAAEVEAHLYVSDLFTTAQDSLNQAELFMSEKKYGEAKRLATFVKTLADSSAYMSPINKEKMKVSAEEAINEATKELSSLKKARIPSGLKSKINQEIKSCGSSLDEAKNDFESGNYKDALDKANEIITRIKEAKQQIVKARGVVGS